MSEIKKLSALFYNWLHQLRNKKKLEIPNF